MKKYRILFLLLLLSFVQVFSREPLDTTKTIVYRFDIKKEIAPPVWRTTQKSMDEAFRLKADYILIHMNTYGGMVDAADSIRTKILNSPIPVIVFIDNQAISAGALISIACDSIYMRKGASIGAATVVTATGEVVPDKFQSFMRSTMRSTAESHGKDTIITANDTIVKWRRDPRIAEAMVDPRMYVPGVIDSTQVLTFTTEEAIKNGYCEGSAENISDVLSLAGIDNYELVNYTPSFIDKIIGFLLNPFVHSILIMVIIGGIYFELQTPGIGFPLAAAGLAAILYFMPLYLEGLAENWELLVFIAGIILIAVEIFIIPGFGITGGLGILMVITGLTLSLVDNVTFNYDAKEAVQVLLKSFFQVTISMILALFLSIWFSKKLLTSSRFSMLTLNTVQEKEEGYIGVERPQADIIGKTGTAYTVLRPSGKVLIEDEIYDATSSYGFIDKGEKVKVIKHETGQLYVTKEQ